jgi:hypothetical protein
MDPNDLLDPLECAAMYAEIVRDAIETERKVLLAAVARASAELLRIDTLIRRAEDAQQVSSASASFFSDMTCTDYVTRSLLATRLKMHSE